VWTPTLQASKSSWGYDDSHGALGHGSQNAAESGRNGTRSGRRSRAAPQERIGKMGPRKPLESSPEKDSFQQSHSSLLPPPPPPLLSAQAMQQGSAVRISLADQLEHAPLAQPMMPMQAVMPPDWQWYQSPEAWGSMETPQKLMAMGDMQSMPMETPPDGPLKQFMPGHPMFPQGCDEATLKAMAMEMHMESLMLPHRLFDSSPEKSERFDSVTQSHSLDSSNSESTTLKCAAHALQSPRSRAPEDQDSMLPLMSPKTLMSPKMRHCMASPVPTTPKRPCYVPETPSPDRMHYMTHQSHALSYAQPAPYTHPGGLAGYYGGMAMGGLGLQAHDQVIPEFLQMMQPCIGHEAHLFADMTQ